MKESCGITTLSKMIAEKHSISQKKAHEIITSLFDIISDEIKNENRVFIRNFGVFKVVQTKERKGRNPRTGTEITIPARKVIRFVPSKPLKYSLTKKTNNRKLNTK